MCGIVGYVGFRTAMPILIDGLKRLEYRGYDSAGVAARDAVGLRVIKSEGRLQQLEARLLATPLEGAIGIAHTRWATHGAPTGANAHPHTDCAGRIGVVHNGIVENYAALKAELAASGHTFLSETDSEVIAHLIESQYEKDHDLLTATRAALSRVVGSYAVAVLAEDDPDRLIAARREGPLIIGLGEGENFVASDIPAILPYTRTVYALEDGEIASVGRDAVRVLDQEGRNAPKRPVRVEWEPGQAEKGGFADFMLKEIHEQPEALRRAIHGRLRPAAGSVAAGDLGLETAAARSLKKVWFVACGTAYHAGLVGRALCQRFTGLDAEADLASEFRYRDPRVGPGELVVVISQSGETADTLAALREARRRGADTLAVVNVVGSSIAREADRVLYTHAGPEIAVASTKAYVAQVACLTLLALALGRLRAEITAPVLAEAVSALGQLSDMAAATLKAVAEPIERIVADWQAQTDAFFIGRGLDWAVALEGQLKLKELSYVHAEALPAGELKHGTLALIAPGVPVVAIATQPALFRKMESNIQEVAARGAEVLLITTPRALAAAGDEAQAASSAVRRTLLLPDVPGEIAPVLAAVPLQLLAYRWAKACGRDVDKPRNLAKSVTVE